MSSRSRNFYFGTDASIAAGSANFKSVIATEATALNLTTAQVTQFDGLDTTLQAAMVAVSEPSTRTPVAIRAKDQAIKNMRAYAILLAKIIYAVPTVTDTQLVSLGLLPRPTRTPVGQPTVAPALDVRGVEGRLVTFRVHDAQSPTRRGKLPGTTGANVFSFVGPEAPSDPRAYHYEGTVTRTIGRLQVPNTVASGATIWLSACWVNARGQTGPACTPVSVTIQGGAVTPEAA